MFGVSDAASETPKDFDEQIVNSAEKPLFVTPKPKDVNLQYPQLSKAVQMTSHTCPFFSSLRFCGFASCRSPRQSAHGNVSKMGLCGNRQYGSEIVLRISTEKSAFPALIRSV